MYTHQRFRAIGLGAQISDQTPVNISFPLCSWLGLPLTSPLKGILLFDMTLLVHKNVNDNLSCYFTSSKIETNCCGFSRFVAISFDFVFIDLLCWQHVPARVNHMTPHAALALLLQAWHVISRFHRIYSCGTGPFVDLELWFF
jgi:hypothetical protein